MSRIQHVTAREILDSRGRPTVEAEVHLEGGIVGRASVPSGASTGAAEVHELRDGDDHRYEGLGVRRAVQNIKREIARALCGVDSADQGSVDQRLIDLDGTPDKSRLGANAILAVSLAAARAAAMAKNQPLYQHIGELYRGYLAQMAGVEQVLAHPGPGRATLLERGPALPRPMTNMISGGKHAGGNLDFQDVLIVPVGSGDYPTQLEWIVRIHGRLGKLLAEAGYEGYLVGDEGGFGPRLASNREAVVFVLRAIEAAGLRPGEDVSIALDVAASHFYRDGGYWLASERGMKLTSSQMIDRLDEWVRQFPIVSIEDGLAEGDWSGWRELTSRLGDRVTLVGDDLFATNDKLLARGIEQKVANAILIKLNQIGTLTETMRTMHLAKEHAYATIASARSGETEDDFLADFAVGTAADSIKIGSIARSERLAKYNRLLRIAEEI